MSSRYWVSDDAQRVLGPMALEVLRDLLFTGKLRGNMHISRDGSGWSPIASFPELTDLLTPKAEADARAEEKKEAARLKAQLDEWKSKPVHEVFKLPADARPEQMRAAFFRLVKRYYPDRLAPEAAPELRDAYAQVFQLFSQLMVSIETRATHGPRGDDLRNEPAPPTPSRGVPIERKPAEPLRNRSKAPTYSLAEFVGLERRGHDRVVATIRVTAKSAGIFVEHKTVNLSTGGVFLAGNRAFPLGTIVDLDFRFEDPVRSVRAMGKVVWENTRDDNNQPRGFGVRFTSIAEPDRLFMYEYVQKLQLRR